MLRRTDFFLWWHTVLPVHLSLRHGEGRVGGQDRGRRHISHLPHAVISSILSSPVFSSPLLSRLLSSLRGSCSGDIIMSHFTRVLPSISPRININHPSPTQQPRPLRAPADKYWCEENQRLQMYMDVCDHTLATGKTSSLPLPLRLTVPVASRFKLPFKT